MNPGETRNLVLVGVGGQGIVLASEIIAQAALAAGYEVKTNEVHGMAQRGGSVSAHVRWGPEVFSPLVSPGAAHVLAALEDTEALRAAHYLALGGLAVVSAQTIIPVTVSSGQAQYPADVPERLRRVFPRLLYLDALGIAEGLGNARAANVVLLGALSAELGLPDEAWNEALSRAVREKHLALNREAFARGREAAR